MGVEDFSGGSNEIINAITNDRAKNMVRASKEEDWNTYSVLRNEIDELSDTEDVLGGDESNRAKNRSRFSNN